MEAKIFHNEHENKTLLQVQTALDPFMDNRMLLGIIEEVRKKVIETAVDYIVKEKMQEIIAAVDPRAIANLALARSASMIAEELKKKD